MNFQTFEFLYSKTMGFIFLLVPFSKNLLIFFIIQFLFMSNSSPVQDCYLISLFWEDLTLIVVAAINPLITKYHENDADFNVTVKDPLKIYKNTIFERNVWIYFSYQNRFEEICIFFLTVRYLFRTDSIYFFICFQPIHAKSFIKDWCNFLDKNLRHWNKATKTAVKLI